MEYKASNAEKFKALIRIAKPDAQQPIAWAVGHVGKNSDPGLFIIRGKPGAAEKGLKKEAKGEKVTLLNLGLLHYHDGEIILNCRKAPSLKVKTDFLEYFDKCKNSSLTRHITLVPPGEWKDDATEDEGDEDAPETEAQQDATVEPVQEEVAPVEIDLAALEERQQKLARFVQLNANRMRDYPQLAGSFKEAATKTVEAKNVLGHQDGEKAEKLIVEAEALVAEIMKAMPPPPPPTAPEKVGDGSLKAYVDQQVADLIALAEKQHQEIGAGTNPDKKPDFTIFSRALSRHLAPVNGQIKSLKDGKPGVDTDVARLKLAIADSDKLEQLLGLKSGEDKVYSALTAATWAKARKAAITAMDSLKQQIKADFAQDAAKIDEGFKPIDKLFSSLDNKLADELERLGKATEADKKEESQKKARKLVDTYRSELDAQSGLLNEIDTNPWGATPNVASSLGRALDAISRQLPN